MYNFCLQGEYEPRLFRHVCGQYGHYCSDAIAYHHSAALADVVVACETYMKDTHGAYLTATGFPELELYSNFLYFQPDEMDYLAVLLTVMLNRIHVCIYHQKGAWHTHVHGECVCLLHLVLMGKQTFITM